MIFSTSFSIRTVIVFFTVFIFLSGCAAHNESLTPIATTDPPRVVNRAGIAVLPIFNISRTFVPLNDIRQLLIGRLKNEGLNIIDDQVLETVMTRHRIRYVGGLDRMTARAFRKEAGAEAVLITTLELYSDIFPPKIALTSRLVSTGERTEILWIDGVGLAGDDTPGLLDLSMIENLPILIDMAIQRLASSLAGSLADRKEWMRTQKIQNKFQPKIAFHSPMLKPDRKYRVAVVPLFNVS